MSARSSHRNPALDTLRGGLLVLMTMTHLPTVWNGHFSEPLGFISAAEGFVFLSAFLAGCIVERFQGQGLHGDSAAIRWVLGRAWRVYLFHLVLLAVAFTVVAWAAETFQRPAVRGLLDFYLSDPRRAVMSAAALIYQPPLLDIFPMYVCFLLLTVPLLLVARRAGWVPIIGLSLCVWFAAQFGLRRMLYDWLDPLLDWSIPYQALGAFDLLAWQFLWVLGLWLGAGGLSKARGLKVQRTLVLNAGLLVCSSLLVWRHWQGTMGFTDMETHLLWIDKWTLSPVRLINLLALLCVLLSLQPRWFQPRRFRSLQRLGRSSIWAFSMHLFSVLLLLLLLDNPDQSFDGLRGLVVLLVGYGVLFGTSELYAQWQRGLWLGKARSQVVDVSVG